MLSACGFPELFVLKEYPSGKSYCLNDNKEIIRACPGNQPEQQIFRAIPITGQPHRCGIQPVENFEVYQRYLTRKTNYIINADTDLLHNKAQDYFSVESNNVDVFRVQ